MDYRLAYENLVQKALERTDIPNVIEKHHIVPKSMGGTNAKSNIVFFTPKEHYVAHHLLWKIHNNREMQYAFWCMVNVRTGGRDYRVTGRVYQQIKVQHQATMKILRTGAKDTDETRSKKSKSHTGVKKGISPLRGREMPIGQQWKVICPHCDCSGTEWNMKRYHFDMCKVKNPARIIESKSKGITLTKHKCPHCDIETSMGNLRRWHFDKCKKKEI